MQGAGGTEGGLGAFFVGAAMLLGGLWMFIDSIYVSTQYGILSRYYGGSSFITMGPLVLGILLLFFNAERKTGWIVAGIGLVIVLVDVLSGVRFGMHMKLWQWIIVLVFTVGGAGLLLRSFRDSART
ncbi:MAG: hypothetical protein AAF730_01130 [Bacteroidota bacterium]